MPCNIVQSLEQMVVPYLWMEFHLFLATSFDTLRCKHTKVGQKKYIASREHKIVNLKT
jgi:hypothetical protein